jgi:hypothetical protein
VIDCRPLGAEKDSRPVGGLRGGSCRGDPPRRRPGGGEPFDIPIGRCAVVRDSWGNVLVLLNVTKGSLITDAETVRSRCLGLMPADSAAREIGVAQPMYDRKVLFDRELAPSEGVTRQVG